MDSVGEVEGGKIWENGIETCKISCMKQTNKKRSTLRLLLGTGKKKKRTQMRKMWLNL